MSWKPTFATIFCDVESQYSSSTFNFWVVVTHPRIVPETSQLKKFSESYSQFSGLYISKQHYQPPWISVENFLIPLCDEHLWKITNVHKDALLRHKSNWWKFFIWFSVIVTDTLTSDLVPLKSANKFLIVVCAEMLITSGFIISARNSLLGNPLKNK